MTTSPSDDAARNAALRAAADRWYAEGCDAVKLATEQWNASIDPARPSDMQRVARAAYERTAAFARSRFKRHDVALDVLVRRLGVAALSDLDATR